jgi:hypothetical protein
MRKKKRKLDCRRFFFLLHHILLVFFFLPFRFLLLLLLLMSMGTKNQPAEVGRRGNLTLFFSFSLFFFPSEGSAVAPNQGILRHEHQEEGVGAGQAQGQEGP